MTYFYKLSKVFERLWILFQVCNQKSQGREFNLIIRYDLLYRIL